MLTSSNRTQPIVGLRYVHYSLSCSESVFLRPLYFFFLILCIRFYLTVDWLDFKHFKGVRGSSREHISIRYRVFWL